MFAVTLLLSISIAAQDTALARPPLKTADSVQTEKARSQPQQLIAVKVTSSTGNTYVPAASRTANRLLVPVRTTPASVSVLTGPVIRDLGLTNLVRALEYVPGITMGQGEGHRDAPTIRGQSTTADFYVDGVRDDAQYFRDTYNIEQIEAIKGPNALAFGRGGGGGAINRVTKKPSWIPVRDMQLTSGSFNERRLALDAGQPVSTAVAARLNLMHEQSASFRDVFSLEKFGVSPAMGFQRDHLSVTVGGEFLRDRRTVDRGIPSYHKRPSFAPRQQFFGDPSLNRSQVDATTGFVIAELTPRSDITLRTQLRAVGSDKFYQNVYANGAVSDNGTEVKMAAYGNRTDRRSVFSQTDVSWRTQGISVDNELLIGAEVSSQQTDNARLTGFFNDVSTSYLASFDRPSISVPVTFRTRAVDADNRVNARVAAAYVMEHLTIGPMVQLYGGIRADQVALTLRDHRTDVRFARTDVLVSPRISAVVTPIPALALYASYNTSALPSAGDQYSSLNATTQAVSPERFTNHEVGAKWGVTDRIELSSAVYRVNRTNSVAPDPLDVSRVVQTGHQRTTGLELTAVGNVVSVWNVVLATAVQHAEFVNRTVSAAAGATVPLVPRTTASVWNAIAVRPWATIGLGVIHQGQRYAAVDNQVTLPTFTRIDASVKLALPGSVAREWTRDLSVSLLVENLGNQRYFATSHGNNNIMPGAPRMIRVTLGFHR